MPIVRRLRRPGWAGLADRLDRIGIQARIMAYVTVGLAVMFGGFAWLGFRAVGEATDLVYEERLATAYTTAGIIERDFLHVARDVEEVFAEIGPADARHRPGAAGDQVFRHLAMTDPFPFFRVTGVWVLGIDGAAGASAGEPVLDRPEQAEPVMAAAARLGDGGHAVIPAGTATAKGLPVVTLVSRPAGATPAGVVVAVNVVSVDATAAYAPTTYWTGVPGGEGTGPAGAAVEAGYHLEVLDPAGRIVIGVGSDERPGEMSRHLLAVRPITARGEATVVVHEESGGSLAPHAIAVVPLGSSPFSLVLEQPVDVALSLPLDLQRSVTLVAIFGFMAALVVAWVTTRHVTGPTEQLTLAAQRMATGDLDSPIRVRAQDEVGRLSENLDAMRRQLRDAYRQVSDANERLEEQVAERTARLTDLLAKVISAQEEERRRLARELHDETAQTIGALAIALDRAHHDLAGDPAGAHGQLEEAQAIARQLLEETRRLILDLRPMALEDLGLVPAIRWYADTHLQNKGIRTTIEPVAMPASRLAPHLEVALFRIAQEAINNISRHAHARRAAIRLSFADSTVRITVSDDGRGFDVDRALAAPGSSVGLLGLRERARLLEGRLDIRSERGRGTELTVEVPVAAGAADGPA